MKYTGQLIQESVSPHDLKISRPSNILYIYKFSNILKFVMLQPLLSDTGTAFTGIISYLTNIPGTFFNFWEFFMKLDVSDIHTGSFDYLLIIFPFC